VPGGDHAVLGHGEIWRGEWSWCMNEDHESFGGHG